MKHKTITIRDDQAEWIDKVSLNLSRFVQKKLDEEKGGDKLKIELGVFEVKEVKKTPEGIFILTLIQEDRESIYPLTEKEYEELERPTTSDKLTISVEPIEDEKK